jgi:S-adenosylmethionine hydrolase
MQWNDHYFIAADNGILSMLSQKIVPKRSLRINSTVLPNEATDLDVFVGSCHLAKGGLMNVGREINTIKKVTNLQAAIR